MLILSWRFLWFRMVQDVGMLYSYIHRALRWKGIIWSHIIMVVITCSIQGRRVPPPPPPPPSPQNWKKYDFFGRKIVIFHMKYPQNFVHPPPPPPPYKWKNMIFFTRNTQKFSRLPPQFFFSSPPPPPLTWDPGSVPGICISKLIISFVNNYLS